MIPYRRFACGVFGALLVSVLACVPADPRADFIRRMDAAPPDERPPDWERMRRLMLRPAPAVGEVAPDFTLATADGERTITRSAFHESRPLVLVFGSYT